MIKLDGFDDCIVGISSTYGEEARLIYNIDGLIDKIMKKERLALDKANEYVSDNFINADFGELSPVFFQPMSYDEIQDVL